MLLGFIERDEEHIQVLFPRDTKTPSRLPATLIRDGVQWPSPSKDRVAGTGAEKSTKHGAHGSYVARFPEI
jgi:hypothetical protein